MPVAIIVAGILSVSGLANTTRKANCRLFFNRTYSDGKQETKFKDVYTKSSDHCQKLSEKGSFTESVRTDLLRVHSVDDFNCQVSIWRERKVGPSEVIEYLVRADSEKDCKKKGSERTVSSTMKEDLEKRKTQK